PVAPSAGDERGKPGPPSLRKEHDVGLTNLKPAGYADLVSYCLSLNRSNSGVRLRTTSDFDAPSEFLLRCIDTSSKYKVVWRHGSSLVAMVINQSAAAAA